MTETVRLFRTVIIGMFFPVVFFVAQQSYAEPVPELTRATPAQGMEMVRETSQRLFAIIEKEGLNVGGNQERLYEVIDSIVFSKFDFYRISGRILGKDWRVATPEQKRQFVEQFKRHLVHTYAAALSEYKGQKIEYLPVRAKRHARVVKVQTRVRLAEASPINVDYVLFLSRDGSWKVVDMLVEGISLVVTHRSSFRMELKRGGLDGLIEKLGQRNQELVSPQ
jgi:phospholipid transport system substrate-binding protein